jgi:hypothetical protein
MDRDWLCSRRQANQHAAKSVVSNSKLGTWLHIK